MARAVRVRDESWVAPPLWASEFRNVLATYVRLGRLEPAQAHDAWTVGRALVEASRSSPRPYSTPLARGLSGYDAEFVALAERLGAPLVTDDRRVLAACPDLAVSLAAFSDEGNGSEEAPPDASDW